MGSRVTDRSKNLLTLLAMLVLLGLTAVVAVVRSPVLGLDLKGGLEVILKAVPNDPKNPPTTIRSTRRSRSSARASTSSA